MLSAPEKAWRRSEEAFPGLEGGFHDGNQTTTRGRMALTQAKKRRWLRAGGAQFMLAVTAGSIKSTDPIFRSIVPALKTSANRHGCIPSMVTRSPSISGVTEAKGSYAQRSVALTGAACSERAPLPLSERENSPIRQHSDTRGLCPAPVLQRELFVIDGRGSFPRFYSCRSVCDALASRRDKSVLEHAPKAEGRQAERRTEHRLSPHLKPRMGRFSISTPVRTRS